LEYDTYLLELELSKRLSLLMEWFGNLQDVDVEMRLNIQKTTIYKTLCLSLLCVIFLLKIEISKVTTMETLTIRLIQLTQPLTSSPNPPRRLPKPRPAIAFLAVHARARRREGAAELA
jgi:hypothetical protein